MGAIVDLVSFFRTVITAPNGGWFCLGYAKLGEDEKKTKLSWTEEFYSWPDEIHSVIVRVNELKDNYDIYFSPYLFKEQASTKDNAIVGRTIVADLDEANILTLQIEPSILVETSPGRHQGYWILQDQLDSSEHEQLSRRLTYSIPRCDRTGWFLGKKVRVPETQNNKYTVGPQYVRIVRVLGKTYPNQTFENLPSSEELYGKDVSTDINEEDLNWAEAALVQDIGPQEMLSRVRSSIPTVVARYNIVQKDRSAALWALNMSLFRAGLSKEQVFYIAYNSPNNKFKELRFGGIRELAKDVLRAQLAIKIQLPDIKSKIREARKLGDSPIERSEYIARCVREHLEKLGDFIHAADGSAWFIRNDTGLPINISARSEHLLNLLDNVFGVNASEKESSYINHNLVATIADLPVTGKVSTLSNYDHDLRTFTLHTGRKDVLVVSEHGIARKVNGYNGLIFPWRLGNNAISPTYQEHERSWDSELFDDCLDNVLNIDKDAAKAILKVWLLAVLLRDGLSSRPILALFGAPGCISADTILEINRNKHTRSYTIKELYEAQHGNWNHNIKSKIQSVKDDIVAWRTISNVVYSGKKETYTVKVTGQKPFRVTKDHRFLTVDGYKRLEELTVGSNVIIRGDNLKGLGRSSNYRTEVAAKYHPHARMKMVGKYGPYGNIYKYRAVYEAEINGLTYKEFCWIINKNPVKAATLTYLPKDVVIHHKDENPFNDKFENLEVKKKLDHDKKHGHNNVRNFGEHSGLFDTLEAEIESIDYYGEEETYDIQMEDDEAPNFLVNNVVVHNSGKSTLFRRIYILLYGRERGLSTITKEDDFDHAMANDPLVVLDNVDSTVRWLPDRLAATVAPTEITKRKLFTDGDIYVIRRQAMVGITAHNPQFGREDVTDRLLLLTFDRLEHFKPENVIYDRIMKLRNILWGDILSDIQTILRTPMPREGFPQFRIEDFAQYGHWIATALGIQEQFSRGINKVKAEQRSFNLEADMGLIDAIDRMLEQEPIVECTAGHLWVRLRRYSRDEKSFDRRYLNSVSLGRKLWTLIDSLRELYDVEWTTKKGVRVWTITKKIEVGTNGQKVAV